MATVENGDHFARWHPAQEFVEQVIGKPSVRIGGIEVVGDQGFVEPVLFVTVEIFHARPMSSEVQKYGIVLRGGPDQMVLGRISESRRSGFLVLDHDNVGLVESEMIDQEGTHQSHVVLRRDKFELGIGVMINTNKDGLVFCKKMSFLKKTELPSCSKNDFSEWIFHKLDYGYEQLFFGPKL